MSISAVLYTHYRSTNLGHGLVVGSSVLPVEEDDIVTELGHHLDNWRGRQSTEERDEWCDLSVMRIGECFASTVWL